MNIVILKGRLTRDPDIRYTQGQEPICVARFNLAVDRKGKKDAQTTADFPSCVAFRKTAESIGKWLKKGTAVAITGRLQTGSYTQNGQKVYTTDVVVSDWEFCESKGKSESAQETTQEPPEPTPDDGGFMDLPEGMQEELPFV